MPNYYIKNSVGSIVCELEAGDSNHAFRIHARDSGLSLRDLHDIGFTVVPVKVAPPTPTQTLTPKNGEVWETKSGNTVLIVERPILGTVETGFIWFDPIDKNLCYATLMDQLSHRLNTSIAEWGTMMQHWMPPVPAS